MFLQPFVPDATMYLIAILGLLAVWQCYRMQIMAGRILAIDIFDRSGIRMYIYAVPDDGHICEHCANAHGRVFSPSQVAKKGFSPTTRTCARQIPCPGVLVGLYGGWLEARRVLERLRANPKKGGIQLSTAELRAVLNGQWERSISAETDRLAVHMLEAMAYERINSALSVVSYRYVAEEAKEIRHLMFLVPAYLGLVRLLLKCNDAGAALQAIDRFEGRFPMSQAGSHFPTTEQREMMRAWKRGASLDDRVVLAV